MPVLDQYARLPLSAIFIDRAKRQRRKLDTKTLIGSIRLHGVINPVIVEREPNAEGLHRLTAGERRCMASMELGLKDIPVRFADELSASEAQILELEENIKREDLTWQDQTLAVQRIHLLYRDIDPAWTQVKTADALGYDPGMISYFLKVAPLLEIDDRIRNAAHVKAAYEIASRMDERRDRVELDRIIYGSPLEIPGEPQMPAVAGVVVRLTQPVNDYRAGGNPAKNILLESFVQWAPRYTGPAFNLIHCDFPYGINVFEGPQSGSERHVTFDDSREIHFKLLETLLINFNRLASQSCHVMYWFSMQHYEQIKRMVADIMPELIIQTHPLVWHKTDNSGIAPDHRYGPRHVYETALLMSRGKRPMVRLVSDAYGAPSDHEIHVHTKPEPMLRYFFGMLVDETTVFLDPTCGSGSSIRAAESLGARTVVGMDTDETIVAQARAALRDWRAKRTAALAQELRL